MSEIISRPILIADTVFHKKLDNGVSAERSGWRDLAFAQHHRTWGLACTMFDLDFIGIEYRRNRASVIVEYKSPNAQRSYPSHPTNQVLSDLGTQSRIPSLGVRYSHDFASYQVKCLNDVARLLLPDTLEMSERKYVEFLYKIRGCSCPRSILDQLR